MEPTATFRAETDREFRILQRIAQAAALSAEDAGWMAHGISTERDGEARILTVKFAQKEPRQ